MQLQNMPSNCHQVINIKDTKEEMNEELNTTGRESKSNW